MKILSPVDLRWYLYNVLKEDELGVPRGQSVCQDWFVRARGVVVGFSNKMVNGLIPSDIIEDLHKRPMLEKGDDPYIFATLASALGPKLNDLMGDLPAIPLSKLGLASNECDEVETEVQVGASSSTGLCSEGSVFQGDIPASDVIVVSPTHRDGLDALLTPAIGNRLRSLDQKADRSDIMEHLIRNLQYTIDI